MSSGHRIRGNLSDHELDILLSHALADNRVKARLCKPFRLITTKDIPLLGSSNIGWTRVFLDRHLRYSDWPFGVLPVQGRRFNAKPGLILHERLEAAVENVFGWSYAKAHQVATRHEHGLYKAIGFDPAAVEKAYAPYIRSDEREPLRDVPTDLDLRPMLGDPKLLSRTHTAQDRQKIPQRSVGYVGKSDKPEQKCGLCSMFVKPRYGGPACTLVKSPIAESGWCRRFKRGALEKG